MIDWIIIISSTLGTSFILLAGVGIVRMPDVYLRISVTTKAATLGIGLILMGAAMYFNELGITSRHHIFPAPYSAGGCAHDRPCFLLYGGQTVG